MPFGPEDESAGVANLTSKVAPAERVHVSAKKSQNVLMRLRIKDGSGSDDAQAIAQIRRSGPYIADYCLNGRTRG